MTREEEVRMHFTDNPEMYLKSMEQIAIYFLIQGEVRFSLLESTLNNKWKYFAMRLKDKDPEGYEKAIKEWDKSASLEDIMSAL